MSIEMDNTTCQTGYNVPRQLADTECYGRFRRAFWPAVMMAGCLSLLIVAAGLNPSDAGTGTHTQLGMPGCSVLVSTGVPCATCGMTTAFAYAADGRILAAIITQPAGGIMAVAVAACSIICFYALIFDLSLRPLAIRLWRVQVMIGVAVLILGSWLYKAMVIEGLI